MEFVLQMMDEETRHFVKNALNIINYNDNNETIPNDLSPPPDLFDKNDIICGFNNQNDISCASASDDEKGRTESMSYEMQSSDENSSDEDGIEGTLLFDLIVNKFGMQNHIYIKFKGELVFKLFNELTSQTRL